MPAVDYFPNDDAQLVVWFQNFATKFASYAVTLGFVVGDIANVNNDYAMVKYVIDLAEAYKQEAKERVQYKDIFLKAKFGAPTPAAPTNPTIAPPTIIPPAAIIARTRLFVNRIKASPAYNTAIGQDLGVIGPQVVPSINAKTKLTAKSLNGSQVEVKFVKKGFDGVLVESRRNQEAAWTSLGIKIRSPFVDDRAPITPGSPEIRYYRAKFVRGNDPEATFSDIVQITTVP